MPNTYSALYVHIIFATKGRLPLIDSAWLGELHAYMAGTLRGLNTKPEIIGGVADHVHALVQIKPTTDLPRLIGELKKASTFWIQREKGRVNFGWQVGYAALSASPFERRDLISYIRAPPPGETLRSIPWLGVVCPLRGRLVGGFQPVDRG